MKRASGRVRKQPETIYPSSDPTAQKRKRAQDADGDEEMEDEDLSEEDSSSEEDEPDEEEIRERKARARKPRAAAAARKPAAKKPKTNGATSLPIRGTKVAKKRAPKKAKQLDLADAEDAGGLFAEVFAHGKDLQEIAKEWRQSFENYESKALAEVINFVLRAAGCTSKVTEHDIEDPDAVASKIEDLQHEYQATEPTDYPFMSKVKNAASFKQGVTGFLDVLIRSIAEDKLLYNNPELIENIQVWFTSMSTASNRAFRHTSTVVSLCVVTSLSTVASNVSDNAAKSHRMVETERKKGNKTNKQRLRSMEASAKEASQLQEFVEALLKDWFDTIFVHRYRDKDISIRRECMAALGEWIVTAPSTFFDGHHLRYMGWMLSDLAPVVRGEVIKQLIRFFKMPDMIGGLKTFTERFRNRMVEIASLDSESHVRASGVELLDLLRENGLLEPDDVDAVGRLVFDADPKVRKTVASFLSESINELCASKIDDIGGLELEESLPEVDEDSYDAPRLEWLKLKCLSEVLEAYDNEESLPSQIERSHGEGGLTLLAAGADSRFTLAASVLYDTLEEVQDWRMLAGYLLFDHASEQANGVGDDALSQLKHEASLSVQEETILLEVLNASVKRNLTDAAEKLTSTKAKLTKRQKNELQAEQEETASDLAAIIPRLLRKFGDSSDTAAAVLRLESILSLPSLHDLRQDSSTFSSLLGDIKKQFMSHSSDKVLEPASVAILHAKSYGELDESAEEKITGLWEDVIQNFSELIDAKTLIARGIASFEELVALSNNLLRTVRLSSVSDCVLPLEDRDIINFESTQDDLKAPIDCVLALIQRAIPDGQTSIEPDEASLEDQIAVRAADAALFYFRWKLKSFTDRLTANPPTDVPYEELEALADRRDRYVGFLNDVLSARKANEDVCAALVGFQLDMYTSAATLKSIQVREGMSDDFTVLIMEFDRETEKTLLKIFSASEKKYARLSGKRLEDTPLAAADVDGDLDIDADPIDDDPVSEPESDDEDAQPTQNQSQSQAQASQQRKEAKQLLTLLAEQRLCELTGKIVTAVIGGVMSPGRARPRLERNRMRLGPNYKEVCAYFDIEDMQAKKGGRKGAAAKGRTVASKTKLTGKPSAKSHAIVAEDEEDDEIEDPEEDDPETLKRRGLVVEEDVEDDEDDVSGNASGAGQHADEMESVLGD